MANQRDQRIMFLALGEGESTLKGRINRARISAKACIARIRESYHPEHKSTRDAAVELLRDRRAECSIAAAALGLRRQMLNAMADHFVETDLVGCKESGLTYARTLVDHEHSISYSLWRHGGWYVNSVRYPSGASGCVSNNYPDKKWRIVCDPRRGELGAEGDYTFSDRLMAAVSERKLATAAWMEFALNKPQAEEAVVERPRG